MSALSRIKQSTLDRFFATFGSAPGVHEAPRVYENSTEEMQDALERKRPLRLWFASAAQKRGVSALSDMKPRKGEIRGEENYLFSSRRYPAAVDNILPAGNSIPVKEYPFFNVAIKENAATAGFPSGFLATGNETNLTDSGKTPQGQGFRIFQEGVSFNMEADPRDIAQILDSGYLEFSGDANTYHLNKGPMSGWPGGWGISGFSDVQGVQAAHHGIADPRAVRRLAMPRILSPLRSFGYSHFVQVDGRDTDASAWNLTKFTICRVWLWGDQMTKVQQ